MFESSYSLFLGFGSSFSNLGVGLYWVPDGNEFTGGS